jgi:hypothetical protein
MSFRRRNAAVALVLLITAAAVASQAPTTTEPPDSTLSGDAIERGRWEYRVLPRADVVRLAPRHRGEFIRAEDVLGDLNVGLGVLGEQGWELVSVEPYHKEGYVSWPTMYVFRRPK